MKFLNIIFLLMFTGLSFAEDNESFFNDAKRDSEMSLADEQASETYIHQGLAQDKYAEQCSGKTGKFKDICRNKDSAFDGGSMETLEAMIPFVTKAYTMIVGASSAGGIAGAKPTFSATVKNDDGDVVQVSEDKKYEKTTDDAGVDTYYKVGKDSSTPLGENNLPEDLSDKEFKPKKEDKNDYCAYIAMVGDMAGSAYMMIQNDKNEANIKKSQSGSEQAAYFYAMADTHKELAKASKVQMGIWGSTAACYGIAMMMSSISGDWKAWAKLVGATLITTFYMKKKDAHEDREELLKKMAKDLPQPGECNPFTDTSCFCAEESSFTVDAENFNRFCVPKQIVNNAKNPSDGFICITQAQKSDPSCACKTTGNCIDNVLKMGSIELGIPSNLMKDPLAGIGPIASGFGTNGLQAVTGRNLAIAQSQLKKYRPLDLNLTNKQKKSAKDLTSFGIPKGAAANFVRVKSSKGSLPSSLSSNINSGSGGALEKINNNRKHFIAEDSPSSFSSGGKVRVKRKKSNRNSSRRKKSASNKKRGILFEDFAQKAIRKAEIIPRNSSMSIFESISNRYKKRTWQSEFKEAVSTN